MADFERLCSLYVEFPQKFRSLMLSTASAAGAPQASYAPFLMDQDRTIYLYVSGLSNHTQNLRQTRRASVLLIEDEASTKEIFARRRLSYQCTATFVDDDSQADLADRFETRFGNIVAMMRQLADFQIVALTPQSGRFIVGFGAAYAVDPNNLQRLQPRQAP